MAWKNVWGVYAGQPRGDDIRQTMSQQVLVKVSRILAKTMPPTKQLDDIYTLVSEARTTIDTATWKYQNREYWNNPSSYTNAIVRTQTKQQAKRIASALNKNPALSWKLYPSDVEFFCKSERVFDSGILVEDVDAWLTTRRNGIEDGQVLDA